MLSSYAVSFNYSAFSQDHCRPAYASCEGGHCQGACIPQWFFMSQTKSGPTFTVISESWALQSPI